MSEFPMTVSGKVRKIELRRQAMEEAEAVPGLLL
jgi:fatty-acyl-CoA synthase